MSMMSTFGSFTMARLGIYAAQKGLSVTGNNIANINTVGYTRQTLDQISLRTNSSDRFQSRYDVQVGSGVLCVGVSQIRDPYLDIRYRSEMSSVGAMDAKLSGLNDLAAILDEVGDGEDQNGLIEAQLSDLLAALQNLNVNVGQDGYDTQVRSSVEALVTLFHSAANKLQEVYNNTASRLDQDIDSINEILRDIRDLNDSIRKSEIHGDSALEQRDERNRKIDELSQYMKIDVIYTMEDIGAGQQVEKLTIKLGGANPDGTVTSDSSTLIDGSYATQLSVNADDNYNVTLSELRDSKDRVMDGSTAVLLDDNDLYGSLQSTRELLTEAGEFATQGTIDNVDESAATKRGIPYYQKSLDLLAQKIAEVFNDANTGKLSTGADAPNSGNLFSNSGDGDDDTGITAANISISKGWSSGTVQIVNSYVVPDGQTEPSSTDGSNILHLIALMGTKMDYNPKDLVNNAPDGPMFHGTFQEMLGNIGSVLGNDTRSTTTMLNTYYAASVELDTSRTSVSGVDLNDEAVNMMQYQRSYSAACRLMTTLDEAIDKLINGTGVVGR